MKYISPRLLTLITTHMCTSNCMGCCYDCSPLESKKMTFSEMVKYIDGTIDNFPTIKTIVFTGGECTLLKEDLLKAISYCSERKLLTRVITNGYWARTRTLSDNFVRKLINAGLTEINFSTGDNHQMYVPFDYIMNAIESLVNTNIMSILISIEEGEKHKFMAKDILTNERYQQLGTNIDRVVLIQSPWVNFHNLSNDIKLNQEQKNHNGCDNIFSSININPYGQLLSCCGFAAEYSSILKLGKYKEHEIRNIHLRQFNDAFKIWLYTKGPNEINLFVNNEDLSVVGHPCSVCFKVLLDKHFISRLIEKTDKVKINEIMLNYNLKITQNENKN